MNGPDSSPLLPAIPHERPTPSDTVSAASCRGRGVVRPAGRSALLQALWLQHDQMRGDAVTDIIRFIDQVAQQCGLDAGSCRRLYSEYFKALKQPRDAACGPLVQDAGAASCPMAVAAGDGCAGRVVCAGTGGSPGSGDACCLAGECCGDQPCGHRAGFGRQDPDRSGAARHGGCRDRCVLGGQTGGRSSRLCCVRWSRRCRSTAAKRSMSCARTLNVTSRRRRRQRRCRRPSCRPAARPLQHDWRLPGSAVELAQLLRVVLGAGRSLRPGGGGADPARAHACGGKRAGGPPVFAQTPDGGDVTRIHTRFHLHIQGAPSAARPISP